MRTANAPRVSCLILVAGQTGCVGLAWVGLDVVQDELGFGSLAVLGSRSVTGFTGLALPAASSICFDGPVAAFEKGLSHIFMADETGFCAGIAFFVGTCLLRPSKGQSGHDQQDRYEVDDTHAIWRVTWPPRTLSWGHGRRCSFRLAEMCSVGRGLRHL